MKYPIDNSSIRYKAFTLIELLVVVAIISLLVSILLPSLNKAKELARQTVCSVQIRNLILGYQFFAEENEGYVPNIAGNYGQYHPDGTAFGSYHWPNNYIFYPSTDLNWGATNYARLWYREFIEDPKSFYCPSDDSLSYEKNWVPILGDDSPSNASYNSDDYHRASYWTRYVPDALYVGGRADVEEKESKFFDIPIDYWFISCKEHYENADCSTLIGFTDGRVDTEDVHLDDLY